MSDTQKAEAARPALETLHRQYLQLVDPSQLRWPDSQTLKAAHVQSFIYDNFFNAENVSYLPPERYQQRVLKLLMRKLEAAIDDPEEDEISDDLMSVLSSFLGSSLPSESESAQQKAYVTYSFPLRSTDDRPPNSGSVTILEARSVISGSGTTGLRTWEAALLLGSFLVSQEGTAMVRGKKVLELGAGTGMLSILCAKHLGVSGIVATDGDEAVVDAIKTNAFLNELDSTDQSQITVNTAALRWGWPVNGSTFSEDYGMDVPDVVLGADVTYDRFVIPALVSTLGSFFELNSGLQVLIAATIRNEDTFETFLNACKRNGFTLELLEFPLAPEASQDGPFYPTSTPIHIWKVTSPKPPKDPFAV